MTDSTPQLEQPVVVWEGHDRPGAGSLGRARFPQRRKPKLTTSSTTVQLGPSSLLWAKRKLHGEGKSCFIFSQHLDKYVSDMLV